MTPEQKSAELYGLAYQCEQQKAVTGNRDETDYWMAQRR
jgi:hypothetical protein